MGKSEAERCSNLNAYEPLVVKLKAGKWEIIQVLGFDCFRGKGELEVKVSGVVKIMGGLGYLSKRGGACTDA